MDQCDHQINLNMQRKRSTLLMDPHSIKLKARGELHNFVILYKNGRYSWAFTHLPLLLQFICSLSATVQRQRNQHMSKKRSFRSFSSFLGIFITMNGFIDPNKEQSTK